MSTLTHSSSESSSTINAENVLISAQIADSVAFSKTIELFFASFEGNNSTPNIPLTFDKNGITFVGIQNVKKKKTNIYMQVSFSGYDLFVYNFTAEDPITLKFEKNAIITRMNLTGKEILGLKVKKGIQSMFISVNEKGEDKLPALIESGSGTAKIEIPFKITSEPIASMSRKNYIDFNKAIKRHLPCELKVEVYSSGIRFLMCRHAEKDATPYEWDKTVSGEKKATYNIDIGIFTSVSNKISRIAPENSTVKYYICQQKNGTSCFVSKINVAVSGSLLLYCNAD